MSDTDPLLLTDIEILQAKGLPYKKGDPVWYGVEAFDRAIAQAQLERCAERELSKYPASFAIGPKGTLPLAGSREATDELVRIINERDRLAEELATVKGKLEVSELNYDTLLETDAHRLAESYLGHMTVLQEENNRLREALKQILSVAQIPAVPSIGLAIVRRTANDALAVSAPATKLYTPEERAVLGETE